MPDQDEESKKARVREKRDGWNMRQRERKLEKGTERRKEGGKEREREREREGGRERKKEKRD